MPSDLPKSLTEAADYADRFARSASGFARFASGFARSLSGFARFASDLRRFLGGLRHFAHVFARSDDESGAGFGVDGKIGPFRAQGNQGAVGLATNGADGAPGPPRSRTGSTRWMS